METMDRSGMAPSGPIVPADSSPEALISQVKELQRNSPHAKEVWIAYTEANGEGHRDPARHSSEFLQAYIQQLNSGEAVVGGPDLTDTIKLLQKRSSNFKTAWTHFTQTKGSGKGDPAKYDMAFHVFFFESLAGVAIGGPPPGVLSGENPMKRMRTEKGGKGGFPNSPEEMFGAMKGMMMEMAKGMGKSKGGFSWEKGDSGKGKGGGGGGGTGDPKKDEMVERIKSFQRMGEQQKELWWAYADQQLGGKRDPAKHDISVLQTFLDAVGGQA